jgi:hypothetical protein
MLAIHWEMRRKIVYPPASVKNVVAAFRALLPEACGHCCMNDGDCRGAVPSPSRHCFPAASWYFLIEMRVSMLTRDLY